MSNQALMEKVDQAVELLSQRLADLVRLAAVGDSSTGQDGDADGDRDAETDGDTQHDNDGQNVQGDLAVATAGVLMRNSQTQQLVKSVQDLLVVTRAIREKWILNQIPDRPVTRSDTSDENNTDRLLQTLLQQALELVVNEH